MHGGQWGGIIGNGRTEGSELGHSPLSKAHPLTFLSVTPLPGHKDSPFLWVHGGHCLMRALCLASEEGQSSFGTCRFSNHQIFNVWRSTMFWGDVCGVPFTQSRTECAMWCWPWDRLYTPGTCTFSRLKGQRCQTSARSCSAPLEEDAYLLGLFPTLSRHTSAHT